MVANGLSIRRMSSGKGAPHRRLRRSGTRPVGLGGGCSRVTDVERLAGVLLEQVRALVDMGRAADDVSAAVDSITDLPEEAEEPELVRMKTRFPVISLSLYGDVARGYLYDEADRIKQRMMQIPGVASVGIAGNRDWEALFPAMFQITDGTVGTGILNGPGLGGWS